MFSINLYRPYSINLNKSFYCTHPTFHTYNLFHYTLKEVQVSATPSVPTASGSNNDETSSAKRWMIMQKPFTDFTESISESSLGTQTTVSQLMRSRTHFLPIEQSYRHLVSKTDSVPYQVKPLKLPVAPDGRSPYIGVLSPLHCIA